MHKLGNSTTTANRMRSDAAVKKMIEELAISRQHSTCGDMEPWEDCPAASRKKWIETARHELLYVKEQGRKR